MIHACALFDGTSERIQRDMTAIVHGRHIQTVGRDLEVPEDAEVRRAVSIPSDQVCTVEPGKFADLVAVPGDPLADITMMGAANFVMKDGIAHTGHKVSRELTPALCQRPYGCRPGPSRSKPEILLTMIRIHEIICSMYVCICNAVTERTIRTLVSNGYESLAEIQALTGCSGSCGQCSEHAQAVIETALARRPALPVIPVTVDLPLLPTV